MSSDSAAVELRGITKTFGTFRALDELDLTVMSGEVHGFLGPNGAGKSTTLRLLLGLLRSDAGHARVLGRDPWREAVELHEHLAYVPGDVTLWPRLSGGETIDLLSRMRGGVDQARRDELVERFQLDPTKKARTYSKGNRQKVALVAAFAADVELLLLDEPTSGLDPLMEAIFAECVREAKARGTTVLLSSHILSEVEQLADRVSIVKDGRRIEEGSLAELRHLRRTRLEVMFRRPLDAGETAKLRKDVSIQVLDLAGRRFTGYVDAHVLGSVMKWLPQLGDGISQLTATPPSLEELFLAHYDRERPVRPTSSGSVS